MINSSDLGELGWGWKSFKRVGRGLKRVGKGVIKAHKVVGKGIIKAHKAVIKATLLLPLKFAVKAARKVGRILCKAPPMLLEAAALQANVDPAFIKLFCMVVRENKITVGTVRRLLPPALKIAAKLAAAGAFPPIVPVLAVVRRIPYISRFAGAELGGRGSRHPWRRLRRFAGAELGAYASALRHPTLRPAVDAMEILALSDHLGLLDEADAHALGLSPDDRTAMQVHLAASMAASTAAAKQSPIPLLAAAGMTGVGVYLLIRNPA